MRQISIWARNHVITTWICIAIIKILLAIIAFFLGQWLLQGGVILPDSVVATAAILFLLAVLCYPEKRLKTPKFRTSFAFRKACDFTLSLTAFIMVLCFLQDSPFMDSFSSINKAYASFVVSKKESKAPTALEILKSLDAGRDKSTLTKSEKKVLKKEFRNQVKNWVAAAAAGDTEKRNAALGIILACIGAAGLIMLLGYLVCTLACTGSETFALIVLFLGAAGIVVGLVAVIRRLTRGPKVVEPVPEH